jgi:hypothetical protein
VVGAPRRASADATAFLGANLTPSNRVAKGVSVGVSLVIVGFEFELANNGDDPAAAAPSLTTGAANVMLQTPGPIFGFQPYVTTGVDIYHEELGAHSETGFGQNVGGGVKISLIGPLRVRLDYRVFTLGSGALDSPVHRVYAGLNLAF